MSDGRRVLVVDDESDITELISYTLRRQGFTVQTASSGREALGEIEKFQPDLLVLDVMMPELSGVEVAKKMKADPTTAQIPILMLTAKGAESDEIEGLAAGADDYIAKPFSMKRLEARITALLRRSGGQGDAAAMLSIGPVRVDATTHEAWVDETALQLTATEFRLLSALIEAKGRVLTRQALISRAIGPGVTVTERTIDVHVTSIRRKIHPHSALILTVRGVGYRATLGGDEGQIG